LVGREWPGRPDVTFITSIFRVASSRELSAAGKIGRLVGPRAGNVFCRFMVRRLHNWSYRDVTDILRENGFTFFKEVGGSHQAWIKRGSKKEPDKVVGLNFTHGSYPAKAVKRMIRRSGIDEVEWIKWTAS
jgi:hypothetical protein